LNKIKGEEHFWTLQLDLLKSFTPPPPIL